MLTVGKVGPANSGYYERQVVAGVEDYYAGDGEARGRWIGRADLVGAVAGSLATAVDSKLLPEAKAGPDGFVLGSTTVTERSVTAFDLTSSAPKSVSVLYALCNADVIAAVERSHSDAVVQAIASVSSRIAYTRTGHAGAAVADADGVFGLRYRHRTSRAMDPQLRDHCDMEGRSYRPTKRPKPSKETDTEQNNTPNRLRENLITALLDNEIVDRRRRAAARNAITDRRWFGDGRRDNAACGLGRDAECARRVRPAYGARVLRGRRSSILPVTAWVRASSVQVDMRP